MRVSEREIEQRDTGSTVHFYVAEGVTHSLAAFLLAATGMHMHTYPQILLACVFRFHFKSSYTAHKHVHACMGRRVYVRDKAERE